MSAQALVNDALPLDVPPAGTVLAEAYRVDGLLGSGGMGIILRATELGADRPVAIKLMTAAAASEPEQVARFRREAKAASSLTSRHVVRVLDFGELASGRPYLVMEHLEGSPLVDVLKVRGQLGVSEAVDYMLQAIHGIAEAHALGIVHRDIKPANLFVSGDPASPVIKVIDFGASKLTAESTIDPSDPGGVTIASSLIGSPRYMAPEQIRTALEVDARADVYALGATLHELLSGKPIFFAETLARIFAQVLWDEPEALSATRDDVPAGLAEIVSKCLAKAPADRYATVEALAVALAPFGASHGDAPATAARPRPPQEPAAASGSKLVAARLFKPGAPIAPAAKKHDVTSGTKTAVVLKATARMPRVKTVSEAPKRTVRIAAFALAARLAPRVGAATPAASDALPRSARTVKMVPFEVPQPASALGVASRSRRTLAVVGMAAVVGAVVALTAATWGARHPIPDVPAHATHGER